MPDMWQMGVLVTRNLHRVDQKWHLKWLQWYFFSCLKLQLKEPVNMNIISDEGHSAECNDVYRNILLYNQKHLFYSFITVKHNNPYNSKVYSQSIYTRLHVSARIGPSSDQRTYNDYNELTMGSHLVKINYYKIYKTYSLWLD
jgi:hypothetical protein